jgi:hypothetical protein
MIFGDDFVIRRLAATDQTNGFKTGDAAFQPLKSFFVSQAQEFHQHGIAKTYVAVGSKDAMADKILGFATLIASEIDIRGGYVVITPEHANRYSSLPAIKLARLAVVAILVNVNGDSGERERLNGVLCWCGWFLLHVFTLGQVFLVFRIVSPVNLMV